MRTHIYKIGSKDVEFNDFLEIMETGTENVLGRVPALKEGQIDEIYAVAKDVQGEWSRLSISERAKYLTKWSDLLLENEHELATIMVKEIAKPYNDALTEVRRTADLINYTVEEMYRLDVDAATSEQFYGQGQNKIAITKRKALGTVLAISPFNYPVNLAAAKIAPALISGNTVVFKPATQGSIVGVMIANLLQKTGIPAGVMNVVTGRGRDIGDYLLANNQYDMLSFTGGTGTGKHLANLNQMKPMVMELGGKDAALVMEDADLEFTAKEIVAGAFNYSGQRCTAIKRVFVTKKNAEKLEALLVDHVAKLTIGSAAENAAITPLIDSKSADFVYGLIEDAKANNNRLLIGGNRDGQLIEPTIFSDVKPNERLAIEEPFGPVLPIIILEDESAMIDLHNASNFGLQVSVFTTDVTAAINLASKLNVGSININGKTSRGPDNFPFTGYNDSGIGVQGIKPSLISMTKPQTIVINH